LTPLNPRIDLCLYLDQKSGTVIACDAHGRPLETLEVAGANPTVRSSVHLANSGPSLSIEHFEVREWDGVVATASQAGAQGIVLDSTGKRLEGQIVGFEAASGELRIALADGQEQRMPLGELRRGNLASVASLQPESAQLATTGPDSGLPSEQGHEQPTELPPTVVQPAELSDDAGNPSAGVYASDKLDRVVEKRERFQESSDSPHSLEVVLMDRTRLKGRCLASTDSHRLRFEADGVRDLLEIPVAAVRGLIGSSKRYSTEVVEQPLGTLKCEEQQLYGYLESASPGSGSHALVWHPQGSLNGSPLSPQASGSINYRKPLPLSVLGAALEPADQRPQRIIAPAVGMFLGRRGAVAKAGNADANANEGSDKSADKPTSTSLPEAREILFRTGDAVDGIVEQIDDRGMRFRSSQTDTQFVPHELIQHVWLNKKRGVTETSPDKLKRLMTVPRSMKKDPPTHLFIAVNGDYLRGRLVSLQGDKLTVEIRLETVTLQTSQIAQIVWLHDRDWNEKESKAAKLTTNESPTEETQAVASTDTQAGPDGGKLDEKQEQGGPTETGAIESSQSETEKPAQGFLVHAIGRTERGLTFHPQQLLDGILSGTSDLLGRCSIAIGDVNQLLFGRDVAAQVRAYREDPWTLSLAQLPRVYMDDAGDATSSTAGGASPLVGLLATDFTLKTLGGETFHLSKNRDRVVVLDFWASWCGPCVQTMPLVEEAVGELGVDKIQLVAVNIQETAARAQAAVDRLKMTSTVLLDSDGQTAAAYAANAIPQTVIIDRAGKVTHVFVGGGPKFVMQFKQALAAVVETADVSSIKAAFEAAGATPAE
ncbi:MAG: TlpA family protein disulfide reductase, partial [Planctomycetales bacterium]|nr:TlpA family protein disulfide reductase [Planctomycetales bacterium]